MNYKYLELLKCIIKENKSGIIIAEEEDSIDEFLIVNAVIGHSRTSKEDERLGQILYSLNLIDKNVYDNIPKILERAKSRGEKLGKGLVNEGLLDPRKLLVALKYQTKKLATLYIHKENVKFDFIEENPKIPEDTFLRIPLPEILTEAIEKFIVDDKVKRELQGVVVQKEDPSEFRELLSTTDKKLLNKTKKGINTAELINDDLLESTVYKSLFKLRILDFIEVRDKEYFKKQSKKKQKNIDRVKDYTEEIKAEDYNNVIQKQQSKHEQPSKEKDNSNKIMSEEFSEEIEKFFEYADKKQYSKIITERSISGRKKQYIKLTKKFHPDKLPKGADRETKNKVEMIFDAINKAYNYELDDEYKKDYDNLDNENLLKKSLLRAKILFKKEEYKAVIRVLDHIKKSGSSRTEVLYVLALAQLKVPEYKKEAEENLLTIIKEEPWNKKAYYHLILLYENEGLRKRALTYLNRALRAFPDDEKIKKLEDMINQKNKKGLLNSLFSKSDKKN